MVNVFDTKYKTDLCCSYLDISFVFFKRFLEDYNSNQYGKLSLSLAHLYKAWDALYQSMILEAGGKIRDKSNKHPLGNVMGITDSFINPLKNNNSNVFSKSNKYDLCYENWKILDFKNLVEEKNPTTQPFFNSLDFLREMRNASEHDFIEIGGGSYNISIMRLNPYIIPMTQKYIDIIKNYTKVVLNHCSIERGHNRGRSKYCSKNILKSEYTSIVENIVHFPLPISLLVEGKNNDGGLVNALVKYIVSDFEQQNKPLLYNSSWHTENPNQIVTSSYLNEVFPYRSLSELARLLNTNRYIIEKIMTANKMKYNNSFVIYLTDRDQKKITLYSKHLLEELRRMLI